MGILLLPVSEEMEGRKALNDMSEVTWGSSYRQSGSRVVFILHSLQLVYKTVFILDTNRLLITWTRKCLFLYYSLPFLLLMFFCLTGFPHFTVIEFINHFFHC